MQNKIINEFGQKAFQRVDDHEDREWQYKDWLRTIKADGYFTDIDMFKWKLVDGKRKIVAITDLTRTDSEEVNQHYLNSIWERVFMRDSQGANLTSAGEILNVPVYLVLFPKSMERVWVYYFKEKEWKKHTAQEWADYLKTL